MVLTRLLCCWPHIVIWSLHYIVISMTSLEDIVFNVHTLLFATAINIELMFVKSVNRDITLRCHLLNLCKDLINFYDGWSSLTCYLMCHVRFRWYRGSISTLITFAFVYQPILFKKTYLNSQKVATCFLSLVGTISLWLKVNTCSLSQHQEQ